LDMTRMPLIAWPANPSNAPALHQPPSPDVALGGIKVSLRHRRQRDLDTGGCRSRSPRGSGHRRAAAATCPARTTDQRARTQEQDTKETSASSPPLSPGIPLHLAAAAAAVALSSNSRNNAACRHQILGMQPAHSRERKEAAQHPRTPPHRWQPISLPQVDVRVHPLTSYLRPSL
jgi:hypothetical protein